VNKSKLIVYVIGAWLFVEAVAFVLVVGFLGVPAALALGLATTLLGLADVKRLLDYLRQRAGWPGAKNARSQVNVVDGGLQALGTLLLILPGFASDLVGLALKAPSIRGDIALRLRRDPRRNPRTIDLAPNEWKSLDHRRRRRRRAEVKPSGAPPVA
jgi:UPF0716 protein FxsA